MLTEILERGQSYRMTDRQAKVSVQTYITEARVTISIKVNWRARGADMHVV
jgi:hypothetical protein